MPDVDGFSAVPSAFRFGGTVLPPTNWVAPRTLADLVADFEADLPDTETRLVAALEETGPVQVEHTVYLADDGQLVVLPLKDIRLAREVPVPDTSSAAGR